MNVNSLNRTRLKKRLFVTINEKTKLCLINELKKNFNRTVVTVVNKHCTNEKMIIKKTVARKMIKIEINCRTINES